MADIYFNNDAIQLGRDLGIVEHHLEAAPDSVREAYERIMLRFVSEEDIEPIDREVREETVRRQSRPKENPEEMFQEIDPIDEEMMADAMSDAAGEDDEDDEDDELDPAEEIKETVRRMRRWTKEDDDLIVGFLRNKQRPAFILDELNAANPDNPRTIGALNQRIYKLKADYNL